MKKYQVIGFPEVDMGEFDAQFQEMLSDEPEIGYRDICYAHSSYLVCHHLQLMIVDDCKGHAKKCCDVAYEVLRDRDRSGVWFNALYASMLCASYSGFWDDLAELATINFYDFEEDYIGLAPNELQYILLELLYSEADDPPEPSVLATKALGEDLSKRGESLVKLWQSVESRNQDEFSDRLSKRIKTFAKRKKPPADATYPLQWIAQFESIVANVALKHGMELPKLPEKAKPRLMINPIHLNDS